jgi:CubicO group peptidase (beta-lactamase class C family)
MLVFWCSSRPLAAQTGLYFPPLAGNAWETLDPAVPGFCPERIDSLYAFLESRHTKSFMLLQDGRIVLEHYFGTFTQDSFWYWASAGKSVTAFLVGQAQEEELLDLGDLSSAYLGTGWTTAPPAKEALITVRHQLSMTTGLDDNLPPTPGVPDPDNCTDPACLTFLADAGTRWAYHNAPYRLLHDVLESASGLTINQFTKSRLFDPTGMKGLWVDHVLYGRARDMARFGLLTLAGGRWGADTLLHDAAYFQAMTQPSQNLNPSYGYLWWLNGQPTFMLPGLQLTLPGPLFPNAPDDLIAALGKNDQKVHVVPSRGWVVVRQGNDAGYQGPGGGQVPIAFDNELWARLNALVCDPLAAEAPEQASSTVRVFPNPAAAGWQIRTQAAADRLRLLDAHGRAVITLDGGGRNEFFIDVPDLPAGLYFLEISLKDRLIREIMIKI